MRRAALLIAAAILLAGPTALAFFSGGFFEGPRLVATFVAWTLVLTLALLGPRPLPTSRPGRVALAGLVLIAAWTGISLAWAPLSGPATDNLVRLLLYLGAFLAAAGLLGDRRMARAVEPALALGALVVIGYGLAGRMLPGILDLAQSSKAYGRLEQPITYWNAEGALAAVGLVLCARLAGTSSRTTAVRVLAAAASGALGMGVYLSYSRGAIAAAVVGLIVLLAAAPSWSQLRAAGIALGAGALAAASAAPFSGVTALEGSSDRRQADGATVSAGDACAPGSYASPGTYGRWPWPPWRLASRASWRAAWPSGAWASRYRRGPARPDSPRSNHGATTTGGLASTRSPGIRWRGSVPAASESCGSASGRCRRACSRSIHFPWRWLPSSDSWGCSA